MVAETAIAPIAESSGAALAEQVVIKGDLSKLTEAQRMAYYSEVCRSLGLNPLTRPFEFIVLNGRLTLYATRGAADQLRSVHGITITSLDPRQIGELYVVVATGRDRDGREDSSTGAVSIKGLTGEALANAMMKAETKAKRRLTLSLAGLGWSDETEVETIQGAQRADVDPETGEIRRPPTLADRVRARTAEMAQAEVTPSASVATRERLARRAALVRRVIAEEGENEVVDEVAATEAQDGPEPAPRARCGAPSPYDDGATCGLPPDHLEAKGAMRVHRALDDQGTVTASWPA